MISLTIWSLSGETLWVKKVFEGGDHIHSIHQCIQLAPSDSCLLASWPCTQSPTMNKTDTCDPEDPVRWQWVTSEAASWETDLSGHLLQGRWAAQAWGNSNSPQKPTRGEERRSPPGCPTPCDPSWKQNHQHQSSLQMTRPWLQPHERPWNRAIQPSCPRILDPQMPNVQVWE